MEQQTDQELVFKTLSGDRAAFNHIVLRYQRAVYSCARRMLRDHDGADEVAQEAFVKAYVSLKSYDPDRKFYTWLLRIALNLCYDALNRRNRHQPLDESFEDPAGDDPLEAVSRQEVSRRVRQEVDRLPREQREIVLLRMDRELSYQEIAGLLRIPMGTVMSRLHRARKTLSQNLQDML